MQEIVKNLEEFNTLISNIAADYKSKSKIPYIFLLKGDLGAGKTQAAKAIAQVFHVKQNVKSPTFVYSYEYLSETDKTKLTHWDLWRLDEANFAIAGFGQSLKSSDVIIVEWWSKFEQKITKLLKNDGLTAVKFTISQSKSETERRVEWEYL